MQGIEVRHPYVIASPIVVLSIGTIAIIGHHSMIWGSISTSTRSWSGALDSWNMMAVEIARTVVSWGWNVIPGDLCHFPSSRIARGNRGNRGRDLGRNSVFISPVPLLWHIIFRPTRKLMQLCIVSEGSICIPCLHTMFTFESFLESTRGFMMRICFWDWAQRTKLVLLDVLVLSARGPWAKNVAGFIEKEFSKTKNYMSYNIFEKINLEYFQTKKIIYVPSPYNHRDC